MAPQHLRFWAEKKPKDGNGGGMQLLADALDASLLIYSPDNEVYRARVNGQWVVIKIVYVSVKCEKKLKPLELLANEVDMLKLAKSHQNAFVVDLIEAHVFNDSVFFMMEMGEQDLQNKLAEEMQPKWNGLIKGKEGKKEEKNVGKQQQMPVMNSSRIWHDIHGILRDMATALADFHRFAIHFSLKPGNWLYVANNQQNRKKSYTLKLIDLQTTVASDAGGVMTTDAQKARKLICQKPVKLVPIPMLTGARCTWKYASPEHVEFCQFMDASSSSAATVYTPPPPQITTKSDIWQFGVVVCEMLARTPQLAQMLREAATKFLDAKNAMEPFVLLTHVIAGHLASDQPTIAMELDTAMQKAFPMLLVLLKAIFKQDPRERPSAATINVFLEQISNFGDKPEDVEKAKEMMEILLEAEKRRADANDVNGADADSMLRVEIVPPTLLLKRQKIGWGAGLKSLFSSRRKSNNADEDEIHCPVGMGGTPSCWHF